MWQGGETENVVLWPRDWGQTPELTNTTPVIQHNIKIKI